MSILVGTNDALVELNGEPTRDDVPVTALHWNDHVLSVLSKGRELWAAPSGDDLEHLRVGVDFPNGLIGRCISRTSHGLFVGTSSARLLQLEDEGLTPVGGFDAADGRDGWYTPWGGPPDTRSLSEGADGALYANVHVGGILRSGDGGDTWRPTIDVDADVHQVLAHPTDPAIVHAATAYGLAMSDDRGDVWRFETTGLHAEYCRAVAIGADVLYLSASRSHRGEQGAVYRRPLGSSEPFERCIEGLPEWFDGNVDSHCLAATGSTAVIGAPDGTVFESTDRGLTWREAATGLGHITCVALT